MPEPVPGYASPEGTARYARRLAGQVGPGHFRPCGELTLSSLGLGTYLGRTDEDTDRQVEAATRDAVLGGWNVLDTAINYRFQRAERALGAALQGLLTSGAAARDELLVCTKGGYLPVERDTASWFRQTYLSGPSKLRAHDLVAGSHCMHPAYLGDQLTRSLDNLGLAAVDVYYLHNPETQLQVLDRKAFHARLRAALAGLEAEVAAGRIRAYGLATWSALRVPPGHPEHLSLAEVKALAGEAARELGAPEDHLGFVQLPFNLGMPEALLATQPAHHPPRGELVPVLEAARALGIQVVASAAIGQARLLGRLPEPLSRAMAEAMEGLEHEAQRVLHFTRSAPGVTTALVGMKAPAHVAEDLAVTRHSPLAADAFLRILQG
jgi:aryl-alcohol dehydrogenase-like predicted oxidoreductase